MLQLNNVSKTFKTPAGEVTAVNGVTLTVADGEFVSIVGKSGSGKSTLLNLIGTLDTPTEGTITLDEADYKSLNAKQIAKLRNSKLGFVFQRFNLEGEYTVLQNVELPLIIAGSLKNEAKVRAVLEPLGIADKIKTKTKFLSGGEQQRVAIARAIVNNPQIILADEPCGNLDTESSVAVMDILCSLNEQGKTVILVTHDEEDAKRAKRIITLSNGKVISDEENIVISNEESI